MKHYLIDPFGEQMYMGNRLFDGPYGLLRDVLQKHGITLATYDKGDLGTADLVLALNYNPDFLTLCKSKQVPREKLVLLRLEPEVVMPEQYDSAVYSQFGRVFTFRDDLIDNHFFYRLRYPQGQTVKENSKGFEERKFLTLINANKYSYVPNELYGLRREAIRFFEEQGDFDLYGRDWDKKYMVITPHNVKSALRYGKLGELVLNILDALRSYRSYRGSVADKYTTLENYRYALCFENEKDAPGYITEKIFDCLAVGTVPVYFGAPNIESYIPKTCFIDLRDFADFSELNTFLRGLDAKDFARYQAAGQAYLRSKDFSIWRPKAVFEEITNQLLTKKDYA